MRSLISAPRRCCSACRGDPRWPAAVVVLRCWYVFGISRHRYWNITIYVRNKHIIFDDVRLLLRTVLNRTRAGLGDNTVTISGISYCIADDLQKYMSNCFGICVSGQTENYSLGYWPNPATPSTFDAGWCLWARWSEENLNLEHFGK